MNEITFVKSVFILALATNLLIPLGYAGDSDVKTTEEDSKSTPLRIESTTEKERGKFYIKSGIVLTVGALSYYCFLAGQKYDQYKDAHDEYMQADYEDVLDKWQASEDLYGSYSTHVKVSWGIGSVGILLTTYGYYKYRMRKRTTSEETPVNVSMYKGVVPTVQYHYEF